MEQEIRITKVRFLYLLHRGILIADYLNSLLLVIVE
uniref:Uncharacterized protein n=1 Tax=Myoviridae sp. ct0jJ30 TaxID=2825014 RepID=A0A8S5PJD0_9CAUD|nr:MAG TPA: hypothetical protein [Myoviridae sp. ct0jJ30]